MGALLYCRAGFEPECAQEIEFVAAQRGAHGHARTERDSAFVAFAGELGAPPVRELVFARQALTLGAEFRGLDPKDRLGPVLDWLRANDVRVADAWVEAPDSTAGGELATLCRGLEAATLAALRKDKRIAVDAPKRLHLCVVSGTHLLLALADVAHASPWRGGIPRLKLPREAPSRSALKIEEAWLVLLDESERATWLRAGLTAVDLGAAPGGWTWQLARKSIRVTAIDNGPLAQHVLDTGVVTHVRADGFRWRPKKPVDWVVCDMVEQPSRVAALMAGWLVDGDARAALFNLKLPM
ncbi:MAG TPA: 23S rRNA (cytidine(2498)-2'-O)-methyltransferase RlmM, partial [Xanthomonadales bacterium]|nr:23S rRNA (cytidine(2498)-2'-O)-methyltransferase RlmM [Xanthomonadales bacterium]